MITIRSHIPLLLLLLIFSTGLLDAYAGEPWKDYSPNQLDSINKLDTLSNRFRYSNNALSKKYAHTALEYAKKIKSTDLTARSYILLGLACLPNNNDSSFFFFEKAIELAKSVNDADLIAHAYYCLAALNEEVGDYETAVILLDSVSKYASISKDERIVVDIFTLLGNIRFNLKDND